MAKNSFKDRLAASKENLLNKKNENIHTNPEPELEVKFEEVKDEVISHNEPVNIENKTIQETKIPEENTDNNTDIHPTEIVETIETTTISKDGIINDVQILPETTYSQLMKGNNLVAKVVRNKKKQKSELDEVFETFEGMSRNDIVKLFTDDIIMKRDKDIRRKLLSYTKKKPNKFKDRMETFSMPVRPEMKTFLHIVGLFSGNAKYMLFEEIILKGIAQMDFDQDSEFDLDDEDFEE